MPSGSAGISKTILIFHKLAMLLINLLFLIFSHNVSFTSNLVSAIYKLSSSVVFNVVVEVSVFSFVTAATTFAVFSIVATSVSIVVFYSTSFSTNTGVGIPLKASAISMPI